MSWPSQANGAERTPAEFSIDTQPGMLSEGLPVDAAAKSAPFDRTENGPFDDTEANPVRPYIDLGGIKVLPREGLNIRLEVEESTKRVIAANLDFADSSVQVQPFSATRTEGMWHEVRSRIEAQIAEQGGTTALRYGALGPELLAQIPVPASAGVPAHIRLARFIGVDGPRWFLRGVISGKAAADPQAAELLDELFRSLVVVRGNTPMPPGELIALKLPTAD